MPFSSLSGVDIGAPKLPGSTEQTGPDLILVAGGSDIWDRRDEFHFAQTRVSGDFTLSLRVLSLQMADLYTKVGIMLRASLDAGAAHVMLLTFGDNQPRNKNNGGLEFQFRATDNGPCAGLYPPQPLPDVPQFPADLPDHWLKLSRSGDVFTGAYSADGKAWVTFCTHRQRLPETALLGLAVTSHNVEKSVTARFSDLTFTPLA